MADTLFSAFNILNSVARFLADDLLARDYLVAWQERNAVETPDGWYFEWDDNYVTYAADATFAARWTNGKGLVALVEAFADEPRFIERPIAEAGPLPQHEVLVPALSLDVTPPFPVRFVQLGSELQWWNRTLMLEGYCRTRQELRAFAELTLTWFREPTPLTIYRHDDNSLSTVGELQCLDVVTDTEVDMTESGQLVYHMVCTARLEYAA